MNHRLQTLSVLCVLAASVVACSTASIVRPAREPAQSQGSSSGGGGFVDENSTRILQMAAKGLANMIRFSSPEIYAQLPEGWTAERLATIIENVRYEPMLERSRENRQLMFDYGRDAKGEYILALKPFFLAYSSFPVKFASAETLANLMKDVRLKLAHESAHHLGLVNDDDAEKFGLSLLNAVNSNTLHCYTSNVGSWPGAIAPQKSPDGTYDWIFHRPTGLGLINSVASWQRSYSDNIDGRLEQNRHNTNGGLANTLSIQIQVGADVRCVDLSKTEKWDDDCWGPSQRTYNWETLKAENGKVTYRATDPFATTETLILDGTATRGSLIYVNKGPRHESLVDLRCQSYFKIIQMPK